MAKAFGVSTLTAWWTGFSVVSSCFDSRNHNDRSTIVCKCSGGYFGDTSGRMSTGHTIRV